MDLKDNLKIEELEKMIFVPGSEVKEIQDFPGAYYLFIYHPKREGYHDRNSRLILSVKEKDGWAINEVTSILKRNLKRQYNFTIVVIPPHDSESENSGIKLVAKQLCNSNWLDGTNCIKRKYSIPPRHEKPRRFFSKEQIQEEKESLIIENEDLIKDKYVILLDDITTTRVSLQSATELLREKNARYVIGIVLGKTSESRKSQYG